MNGESRHTIVGVSLQFEAGGYDPLFKKVAWRIMPFIFVTFVLAFIDRVNIGYAKLQFAEDLGLSDTMYGAGAGIFFIGYLVSGIPSNLLLARIGASATISRIMIMWGIVSAAMMFISTPTQFYVLRFLLGVAEGGLAPGVYLYLTYWFPDNLRARMVGIFLAAIPVAGVFGAPLSGFLLGRMHNVWGLNGWQWMFLLEALPSITLGAAAYFYLENSPAEAKWLSREEKDRIVHALDQQTRVRKISKRRSSMREAAKSKTFLVLLVIEVFGAVSLGGFSFWLPQIVHDLGVRDFSENGYITAIPYLFGCVGMLVWGYSSDRFRERRWHYTFAALVGAVGLAVTCLKSDHFSIAIISLSLGYAGIISGVCIFWAYTTSYLKSSAAVIGIALINAVASLASFGSQYAFGAMRAITKNSVVGLYGIAACMFIGALLVLCLPKNLEDE